MKQGYLSLLFVLLSVCFLEGQDWMPTGPSLSAAMAEEDTRRKAPSFQWPWQAARTDYFGWWFNGIERRLLESFEFRPGVRYVFQTSTLGYQADETVLGGEIVIDDDLLNAVDFPGIIENRLRATRIELPTGFLQRETRGWTSMAQQELNLAGVRFRATYWSGALAPRQFPQPGDLGALFDADEFIGLAAREIASTSALNNAVSLEINLHPLMLLTGFRRLEWNMRSGFYLLGDFSFGWVKSTDLTFRQGRELLGDVDMGQEIRDILPDPLENLINTDEAGDLLLTAVESRLPLYGFGLPIATGRTMEWEGWLGYHWSNSTWSGDARLGFTYQRQQLSNEHPSAPVLDVVRWIPAINVKWVFNKAQSDGSIFDQ
ncbi:MAG: hypothetical protein AAFO02_06845 [Bacteroidota bacterium]